ncbi:SLC13 family permease [Flintibacter sp. KGMB00164]|uniref:SLC13 family permease n=1 Tax=Flintibacter sp. KGMB00164 TaxID=2610895 RepID=UPI0012456362|nr:SLC13 family permease [Flintibacter sp. KGMB00164]
MTPITISLLVFLFMVVSFCLNKIPMSVTAMIGLVILVLTGCVDVETALGNFGSTTVITMVSMFIIAEGLNRTQMLANASKLVYKVAKGSFTKVLAGYVIVTLILGQFMPSIVALFALVCPLVVRMCEEMNVSPSKMVYSIGITTVSASFAFPIGTMAVAYIEDNGYLASYGYDLYQFGLWDLPSIKIVVALFVAVWAIFVAPKLAPDAPEFEIKAVESRKSRANKPPLKPLQEVLGYGVFIAVVLCLMFQSYLGVPSWAIAMIGAIVVVAGGVLTEREAIDSMNIGIIVLYVGVLTLGNALANTGAGEIVGDFAAGLLNGVTNSYVIGAIFYLTAFIMTSVLYNRAVNKILIPLCIMTCMSLNCDPRGPMIMCYIGSQASVITPLATAVVPMMMGAGGYSQKTIIKMGILPALCIGVVAVGVGMTIFPAFH